MTGSATATTQKMAARDVGMSERTFYRWKALGKPIPQPQHMAHVVEYMRSLSSMARLEFRAYARRCHLAKGRP